MFEAFTNSALKILASSYIQSHKFGHDYLGTEHILLGIMDEKHGFAARILKSHDITKINIAKELAKHVKRYPVSELEKIPKSPRAKRVFKAATEEARLFNIDYVNSEHILLALLKEKEGVAYKVLSNLELNYDIIKQDILKGLVNISKNNEVITRNSP